MYETVKSFLYCKYIFVKCLIASCNTFIEFNILGTPMGIQEIRGGVSYDTGISIVCVGWPAWVKASEGRRMPYDFRNGYLENLMLFRLIER